MTVASPLVASDSTPSASADVWSPAAILKPDWGQGVQVITSYSTAVAGGQNGAETRRSLTTMPRRAVQFQPLQFDASGARNTQIVLERLTRARGLIGLWSDFGSLSSAIAVTDTLPLSTDYKRFVVGGYVVLVDALDGFEIAEVQSITPTQIVLTGAIAGSFPAGSYVVPLLEVQPSYQSQALWLTAAYLQSTVDVDEVLGDQSYDPTVAEGVFPSLDTYSGDPIWPWYENLGQGTSLNITSDAELHDLAGGQVAASSLDALPRQSYSLTVSFADREEWWEFLQFFDACRGRLNSFWMLSPGSDFSLQAINSPTELEVTAVGPVNDWEIRGWIGLDLYDGSQVIAQIDSVVRASGTDTITLTDGFGAVTADQVMRCCLARRCRLGKDSITETWLTSSVVQVQAEVQELHQEATVAAGYASLFLGPEGTGPGNGCGVGTPIGLVGDYHLPATLGAAIGNWPELVEVTAGTYTVEWVEGWARLVGNKHSVRAIVTWDQNSYWTNGWANATSTNNYGPSGPLSGKLAAAEAAKPDPVSFVMPADGFIYGVVGDSYWGDNSGPGITIRIYRIA